MEYVDAIFSSGAVVGLGGAILLLVQLYLRNKFDVINDMLKRIEKKIDTNEVNDREKFRDLYERTDRITKIETEIQLLRREHDKFHK